MGPIYLTKRALIVIAILLMQSMVWSDAEIIICIFYLTHSAFLTDSSHTRREYFLSSKVKLLPAAISFNQDQNQALSVRALQEIISSNDAEAVSSFFILACKTPSHDYQNTRTCTLHNNTILIMLRAKALVPATRLCCMATLSCCVTATVTCKTWFKSYS